MHPEIDFLVGTFGKAAASTGAHRLPTHHPGVSSEQNANTYFYNGSSSVNIAWTLFIVRRLGGFRERRIHLENISNILREALKEKGYECPSASYIVPMIVGKKLRDYSEGRGVATAWLFMPCLYGHLRFRRGHRVSAFR